MTEIFLVITFLNIGYSLNMEWYLTIVISDLTLNPNSNPNPNLNLNSNPNPFPNLASSPGSVYRHRRFHQVPVLSSVQLCHLLFQCTLSLLE